MVTITYAFCSPYGCHTGVLVVEDWTVALDYVSAWSNIQDMSWIRVQHSVIARDYMKHYESLRK